MKGGKATEMDKTAEQLYAEREKRVMDTIHMKIPDRVPVQVSPAYFPARYAGISYEAAYYDYDLWLEVSKKMLIDFEPDIVQTYSFFPGKVHEILEPKNTKWPGHGVPSNKSHQAVELEIMREDEYDHLLGDPTDFMWRVFMPRAYGSLKAFDDFPRLGGLKRGFGFNTIPVLAQALAGRISPRLSPSCRKPGGFLPSGGRRWRLSMTNSKKSASRCTTAPEPERRSI
jgi:hypothetical protein